MPVGWIGEFLQCGLDIWRWLNDPANVSSFQDSDHWTHPKKCPDWETTGWGELQTAVSEELGFAGFSGGSALPVYAQTETRQSTLDTALPGGTSFSESDDEPGEDDSAIILEETWDGCQCGIDNDLGSATCNAPPYNCGEPPGAFNECSTKTVYDYDGTLERAWTLESDGDLGVAKLEVTSDTRARTGPTITRTCDHNQDCGDCLSGVTISVVQPELVSHVFATLAAVQAQLEAALDEATWVATPGATIGASTGASSRAESRTRFRVSGVCEGATYRLRIPVRDAEGNAATPLDFTFTASATDAAQGYWESDWMLFAAEAADGYAFATEEDMVAEADLAAICGTSPCQAEYDACMAAAETSEDEEDCQAEKDNCDSAHDDCLNFPGSDVALGALKREVPL